MSVPTSTIVPVGSENAHGIDVVAYLDNIQPEDFKTERERAAAKGAAEKLLARLETPSGLIARITLVDPSLMACLGTSHELCLFQRWSKDDPTAPKSCTELARMTGCNISVIRRICRNLNAHELLAWVDPDTYKMRPKAQALSEPPLSSCIPHGIEARCPPAANWPSFLKSVNFADPSGSEQSNLKHLYGMTNYEWFNANPKRLREFQHAMQTYTRAKQAWVDIYPTDTLVQHLKPGRAVVVDIGGGHGLDSEAMRKRHPDLPRGSLVLQDRPEVIQSSTVHDDLVKQPHDMFTEQPKRGARAYYFHCVIHNWSDAQSIEIFRRAASAMEKGYSKLLIHDVIIQEDKPSIMHTTSDIQMAILNTGRDRSEGELSHLLAAAGLKIARTFCAPGMLETIIEAVLVAEDEDR